MTMRPVSGFFNRGFTMTELAVILAIIAIALVPLVGIFTSGAAQTSETVKRSTAVEMAAEALEIMKSMSFDFLAQKGEHPFPPVGRFDTRFDRTVVVTQEVPDELLTLEARVTWKEQNKDLEIVLRTLVSNPRVTME